MTHCFHTIPDESLRLQDVPAPNAEWDDISDFAATYDGYEACGSFEACADIASRRPEDSLHELRAALFFHDRAARHSDEDPDGEYLREIQSLIERVRRILERDGR